MKFEDLKLLRKIPDNSIVHGDCFDVMPYIDDKSIDAIICDLPFGTTKCNWDCPVDLNELWKHYKRIIKNNGVILLFAQTPFDKVLGCSNLEWLRYEWIWQKTHPTGHLNAKKMPMKAHENILVFYKNLPTYNPQKTYGHKRKVSKAEHKIKCIDSCDIYNKGQKLTTYDSTERYPTSIQTFASDKQNAKLTGTKFSTQKPLKLLEYLVKSYTNEGDLVFDSCAGSGTTGLAAKNLNRKYIMIEIIEEFYNLSLKRIN